jgi:hypothetical protein
MLRGAQAVLVATSGEVTAEALTTIEDKLQSLAAMVSVASVHSESTASHSAGSAFRASYLVVMSCTFHCVLQSRHLGVCHLLKSKKQWSV